MLCPSDINFLWHHDSYKKVGIDANLNNIYIQLNNSSDYTDAEDAIGEIKSMYPDVEVLSKRQAEEQKRSVLASVNAVSIALVSIITIFGLVNLINNINSRVKERRRVFSSLRSIGMTKKQVLKTINIEMCFMILMGWIMGAILGSVLCVLIGESGTAPWKDFFPYGGMVLSLVVLIAISLFTSFVSVNKLFKHSIVDMNRLG
jgi:putative ABC transport system permease protein